MDNPRPIASDPFIPKSQLYCPRPSHTRDSGSKTSHRRAGRKLAGDRLHRRAHRSSELDDRTRRLRYGESGLNAFNRLLLYNLLNNQASNEARDWPHLLHTVDERSGKSTYMFETKQRHSRVPSNRWSLLSCQDLAFCCHMQKRKPPSPVLDFNRDIRPILSENCFYCHGQDANKRQADLRLDMRDAAIEAGAIVPKDAGLERTDRADQLRRIRTS